MKKIIALLTCLFIGSANAGIITLSDLVINEEINDHYFTVTATGLVTIEVTETIKNNDGFDTEINLFNDDGSLDLADFIKNNDDGFSDGTFGSRISMFLDAGDYLLRIGSIDFGNEFGTDAVIIASSNSNAHNRHNDYDLTISGNYVTSEQTPPNSIPEPSALALLAFGIAGLGFARKKKSA